MGNFFHIKVSIPYVGLGCRPPNRTFVKLEMLKLLKKTTGFRTFTDLVSPSTSKKWIVFQIHFDKLQLICSK